MNYYSQFHEDALVDGIFRQIGTTNKFCVDIGAHDGVTLSNTRGMMEEGWQGCFVEPRPERYSELCRLYPDNWICNEHITSENLIDNVLDRNPTPTNPDFMSLDIDGQECYVWQDMVKYRPRVVVVEWSPYVGTDYLPIKNTNGKKGYNQAGLHPMLRLAHQKNYCVVAITPVNLICVDRKLCPERDKYWDGEFLLQ